METHIKKYVEPEICKCNMNVNGFPGYMSEDGPVAFISNIPMLNSLVLKMISK